MLQVLRTIIQQLNATWRRGRNEKYLSIPFSAQTRAGGIDVVFFATLHTDDNNVILIENVLLIITFLVPKLDDNEIVLLTRGQQFNHSKDLADSRL